MKIGYRRGFCGPDGLSALAALCGLFGVAMGAFGAHALKGQLALDSMAVFHTATQYQLWHSVAVLAIANLWRSAPNARLAGWSGVVMLAGVVLFSGSLFALSLTQRRWLGMITPFGGVGLVCGWLLLAIDRALAIRNSG